MYVWPSVNVCLLTCKCMLGQNVSVNVSLGLQQTHVHENKIVRTHAHKCGVPPITYTIFLYSIYIHTCIHIYVINIQYMRSAHAHTRTCAVKTLIHLPNTSTFVCVTHKRPLLNIRRRCKCVSYTKLVTHKSHRRRV